MLNQCFSHSGENISFNKIFILDNNKITGVNKLEIQVLTYKRHTRKSHYSSITTTQTLVTIMLNLIWVWCVHKFHCHLLYDPFWHMLALQLHYSFMHRLYLNMCMWDRNNQMCQSILVGSSFLSLQPPQMLSRSLLLPLLLSDSNIQIFSQEVCDRQCNACVHSCMRMCRCDLSSQVRSFSAATGRLFIRDMSSFALRISLFTHVVSLVEKPLTSEIEIYTE